MTWGTSLAGAAPPPPPRAPRGRLLGGGPVPPPPPGAPPPPAGGSDHPAPRLRRAGPDRRHHAQPARPASPDDPGPGTHGLAEGGRLRPALARGNRRVPVQGHHRSAPSRSDSAQTENGSQGRLPGAQPDDPARHARLAAHRLNGSDSRRPT